MSGPRVDADLIRELAALLDETGLSEIEWEGEGQRVRVAKHAAAAPVAREPVPEQRPAPPPAAPAPAMDDASHPGAVTSPMVGTAYLSPEPDARPFVQAGDTVAEGQTLLIVEAMKMMNPIPAPRSGRVAQVLVSNGAPVEYGEVLVIID
ncbi:MAG: acetyl-CoA carboxylase biotin carboxyl carrier protein [Proteobacteria bacterium]|nr:acetyl-CoA carboxylase biotin carboxyl carrier protein [Pseudomonadota bacterium]MCH8189690.1 acetyl-CoA carboxylase biotin carboxyl carrier protein [Pseudomonadota bacterium]